MVCHSFIDLRICFITCWSWPLLRGSLNKPVRIGRMAIPGRLCAVRHLQGNWLRTNGVNTNVAAAKVMIFDRLGEKVRPGTFGKIKGVPKKSQSKNMRFAVTPLVLTPAVPFRRKTACDNLTYEGGFRTCGERPLRNLGNWIPEGLTQADSHC